MIPESILTTDLFQGIGWALVHTIWQGLVILLLLYTVYYLNGAWTARKRYLAALAAMTLMVFSFFATVYYFGFMDGGDGTIFQILGGDASMAAAENNTISLVGNLNYWLNENMPVLIISWLIGMVLFSLRLGLGIFYLKFLSKGRKLISEMRVVEICNDLSQKMKLSREVKIYESKEVQSPFTIGFIRPCIYLPLALINNLTLEETKSILAHELAHIKRNDFLINLFVSIAEILFYYHPVMWWLSAIVKAEREEACDDLALQLTKEPIIYAKALLKIKEITPRHNPVLTMGLSASEKHLLNRIKNILNMPYTKINLKEKLIATMAILALAIIVIKTDLHGKDDEKSGQNKLINFNIERVESIQDTVPNQERREEMTIIRKDGKEDVEMKMEDGKITTLKINGKEVDPEDFDKHKDILDEMRFKRMSEDDFSFGSPENGNLHRFEFNFGDDEGQNFSFDFPDMQNFKFKLDSLSTMNFPGLDSTFAFGFMGDTHSAEISEMMEKLKNQMGEMNHLKGFYFPGSQDKFQWFGNKDQDDDFDLNKDENLEDMLGSQLNADGFLIPGQENLIELSSKSLKINGEKQPSNIFNKYKRIFERETGLELSKNTKLEFNIIGKEAKRKYRAF